jgi:hypothetical protein
MVFSSLGNGQPVSPDADYPVRREVLEIDLSQKLMLSYLPQHNLAAKNRNFPGLNLLKGLLKNVFFSAAAKVAA